MRKQPGGRITKVAPRVPGVNTQQHPDFADLHWDDVRLFRAIDQLGSMRKVASDQGVVVNTIRRRIVRVEARLGLDLYRGYRNTVADAENVAVTGGPSQDDHRVGF